MFGICRKQSKFSFDFILNAMEMQKAQANFFLGRFSFDLNFAVCLLGIILGVNQLYFTPRKWLRMIF